jgi:hypothetical protein
MFLISKYVNVKTLWVIYVLINTALLGFIVLKTLKLYPSLYYTPFILVLIALFLFAGYCFNAYKIRIRKKVDEQMKVSLLSVVLLFLPLFSLAAVIFFMSRNEQVPQMVLLYGFCIFFGWITAIIMGMTFKTLPFIIWNKVYTNRAEGKTPAPKELFSEQLFQGMAAAYLTGFALFFLGMIFMTDILLKSGAVCLLAAAVLYTANVLKTAFHQPAK